MRPHGDADGIAMDDAGALEDGCIGD